jgi:exodeoxyribonuclease-3
VAILTKVKPLSAAYGLGITEHDGEGRVITLEFESFYLVACYTPNAGEGLKRLKYRTEEWDIAFFKYVQGLEHGGKAVIVSGDLNCAHKEIDIYDTKGKEKVPGFTPEERANFDMFLSEYHYIDTFRKMHPDEVKYTFWSMRANLRPVNKGWRLDYFLIDQPHLSSIEES